MNTIEKLITDRPLTGWMSRAARLKLGLLLMVLAMAGSAAAQPANDNFANYWVIGGLAGTTNGDNTAATLDLPCETNQVFTDDAGPVFITNSVWFAWTAPASGPVEFDTGINAGFNPTNSSFNTVLSVWTDTNSTPTICDGSLTNLIADNQGGGGLGSSHVSFLATSNTTYYISVASQDDGNFTNSGGFGPYSLNWSEAPNDNFTNYWVISGLTGSTNGDNTSATLDLPCETNQVNTDDSGLVYVTNSVWFAWTAPASGPVEFHTTYSSVFDTVLSVWTDTNSPPTICDGGLANLISDNLGGGALGFSYVNFMATSNTTYYISVASADDGSFTNSGGFGPYFLNWNEASNDNFTNAWVLSGASGTTNGNNLAASLESCEAASVFTPEVGLDAITNSVWFAWTATTNGALKVDNIGSDTNFDFVLSVWTSTNGSPTMCDGSLTNIVADDGGYTTNCQVIFPVVAGTTYYISLASQDDFSSPNDNLGSYVLNWQFATGPFNDNLANAQPISGASGTVNGSNVRATLEPGEPVYVDTTDFNSEPVTNSIWYQWTSPVNGPVSFDTVGSTFDTLLVVYTNSASPVAFSNLVFVTAEDDIGGSPYLYQSRVNFLAVSNTTYYISVNTSANGLGGGGTGAVQLNWAGTNISVPTISSGTFGFTATSYTVADSDSFFPTDPNLLFSVLGGRVTVTRYYGFCGRVHVPYTITGDATQTATGANTTGELIFDDYQMSSDIVVPLTFLPDFNPGTINVTLGTPYLDALESSDLIQPSTDPTANTTTVTVLSDTFLNQSGTNPPAFFNIERSTFRVPETFGSATIFVYPSKAPPANTTYTVNYSIDPSPSVLNTFTLQAGSDYATPNKDYNNVSGTLTWPAGDANPKSFTIPITDDELAEFNEDMLIVLSKPLWHHPGATDQALGQVSTATLTILGDDQPAGAVDRNWNVEGTSSSVPPNLTYPGTSGGVVDGANGNGGTVYAAAEQPDGRLILGGSFNLYDSNPYNRIVRVQSDGYPDFSFLAAPNSGANGSILALALYPTNSGNFGKILIGGTFTAFNGSSRFHIAELDNDGTLDAGFDPGLGANGTVRAMALESDGKIYIGGDFTTYNGTNCQHLARLNADGSLDTSFNPGSSINGPVYALAAPSLRYINISGSDSGGKTEDDHPVDLGSSTSGTLTVQYQFYAYPDDMRVYYGGTNGVLIRDTGKVSYKGNLVIPFGPTNGLTTNLITIVVNQGNITHGTRWNYTATVTLAGSSQVYAGGAFTAVGGVACGGVARLNGDGTLDTGFAPGIGTYNPKTGNTDPVRALAVQTNGQLVVGGSFAYVEMTAFNGLSRFNVDGTVDTTFGTVGATNGTYNLLTGVADTVNSITLQPDGTILVGGDFMNINQVRRVGIARLYNDGSLDTSFMDSAYNQFAGLINHYHNSAAINTNDFPMGNHRNVVNAIAVEPGTTNVIIGGSFLVVGGGSFDHSGWKSTVGTETDLTGSDTCGIVDNARMDVHPRSNVARLVGGGTPGPGNVALSYGSYTVGKSDSSLYVSLTRTNGNLGIIGANFNVPAGPAGQPGIAVNGTDYTFNNVDPTWNTIYELPTPGQLGWMVGDGYSGPNFYITLGDSPPGPGPVGGNVLNNFPTAGPGVKLNIFNNGTITGNLNANLTLSQPNAYDFYLGGELIPLGAALGAQQNSALTIVDPNFLPGVLAFSSPTYIVNANGATAVITVTRTNFTGGAVQVNYATGDGTATNGVNYTGTSGTLSFGAADSSKTFTIPILAGSSTQPDRTVNLALSAPTGGATLGQRTAVLTIVNNYNGNVHLGFVSATNIISETGGTALIGVNRLGSSSGTITVTAMTSDGTATNGTNYLGTTNTLTWNDSDVSPKFIAVPVIHDGVYTPDLMLNLTLTNTTLNSTNYPAGLSYGGTNAVLNITNVDFPGMVAFTATNYSVKKYGGYAVIPVIRTGGSAGTVTVDFSTADNTAINGADYTATNNTLTFTNGQVFQSFQVPITATSTSGFTALNLVLSNAVAVGSPAWVAQGSPSNAVLNIIDTSSINEPPGSPDVTYSPLNGFNAAIYALALQTNNQLIVGGDFTMANGVYRQRLARINDDGTLDASFLLPASTYGADDTVRAVAIQSDGRILVGGYFTDMNNVVVNGIARLNYDGSLDSGFNVGAGADNPVYALAQTFVNGNAAVLVGGSFAHLGGVPANGIGRLTSSGVPDPGFNAGTGANGTVYALAVQTDGRVVIGGDFTMVNGVSVSHIARLNTDGSVDLTFTNGVMGDSIRAITIQLDGQILAGGLFTCVTNGADGSVNTNFNHIARLNGADGSPDSSFNPGLGANNSVLSIALQTDGRMVVGGIFTSASGVTRNRITRLNTDGSVDPTINFGVGADNFVNAVVVEESVNANFPPGVPDEKIIIGGGFLNYFGESHPYLARIYGGSIGGSGSFSFSQPAYGVNENGTNVVITVQRAGGTSGTNANGLGDIFVNFATTNGGTAVAGTNFVSVVTNLDFPAGEVQTTVMIPVMDDQVITSNLTVNLTLTPIAPAEYGAQPTAVLTITNVDSAISFTTANYQVNKYGSNVLNGFAPITINRLGATYGTSTIVFNTLTNGTATVGVDYQPETNVLVTFAPGDTVQQVNIPIINGVSDGNTTVNLQLTDVTGSALYDPSNAVLTILDQTLAKGSFEFSATNYVVTQGGASGQTLATITVLRTNGASGIVSVSYNTADGTAAGGVQYVPTSGQLTFGDGVLSQTFTVPVYNTSVASLPLTLSLLLSSPTGGAGLISPTNATLTILNTNTGFFFAAATNTAPENSGFVSLTVMRNNTNGVTSVDFATADGTGTNAAVNGTNYIGQGGTLLFAAGQLATNIIVPLIYNEQVTGDLQFTVGLTNPVGAQLIAPSNEVVVVQDADAGVSFTNSVTSVLKNGTNAVLAVVCSNPRVEPVSVSYFTMDGTATNGIDYTARNGTLVFTNGVTTNYITVPIINNQLLEGNVNFSVVLTNAVYPGQLISPSTNVVTIIDSNPGISFSSPVYTWTRAAGVQALISVIRTGNPDSVMSVNYATANGTGTNGFDYVATSGTLVFTNGVTNQTFAVTVINRLGVVTAKTVLLSLSNPTNGVLVAPTNAVLTILSDTNTYLSFALATNTVPENAGFVSLNVLRFNNPAGTVSVAFGTADGTAAAGVNYTATNGVLTFTNGQVSQTVDVPLIYDPQVTGNLQFTVGLTNPVGAQLIAPSNEVVVVQDADAGVSFTNSVTSVLKNGTNAVLAVVCSNPRVEPVSVSYFTMDGTATNGIDYTARNGTLVFTNGVTTNYITVPIINNQLLEGNVNFSVVLTNAVYPGQLISPSTNVVTIIDSNPGISFSSPAYTVARTGVQASISVNRTGYTDSVMSVKFATADGTATNGMDYVATNGVLVFTNGVTNLTFAVTIINQVGVQPPKTVLLSLSNPTNAIMVAPTNAVLTITDTNAGVVFASANYSFNETTPSATINVLRYNDTSGTNVVYYSTTDGPTAAGIGAAVAGVNYVAQNNQALVFYPGITQIPIAVPLLYDTNATGPLQFSVSLTASNGSGAQIGTPGVTTVLLQDADTALSFTTNASTVLKNAGSVLITVSCSNTNVEPVSINYATSDGTATNGIDYTATSGTLTFSNGVPTNSFPVPIIYNSAVSGNHTFNVYLSSPTNPGRFGQYTNQVVTIADSNSGLNFSSATYTVLKTAGGAFITVNRTDNTNSVCSVNFSATNGTAVNGQNYTATNGTLVFTNGVTSQTFTVPIVNSTAVQPDLTVLLALFNASNAILTRPSAATLTIRDNSGSYVIPAGSQLVTSTSITNYDNNLIGSNDTVQVLFAFRDASLVDVTNLVATLLATNGVTNPSPAAQTYGPLAAYGHSVSQPFTFTALGTNGQQIAATFQLTIMNSLGTTNGTAVFGYTLGTATSVFSNNAAIIINDTNAASPYPSVISVRGVGGSLIKATVTLNKFSHSDPHDVSALVVAPAGTNTLIMSHAGQNGYGATNLVITIDDAATNSLPSTGFITNGTYLPTIYAPPQSFP